MTGGDGRPVLLAYDGSDDARRAVDAAGALLGPCRALVLHVYQPFVELMTGGEVALPKSIASEAAEANRMDRKDAEATVAEGAEAARAAGFDATALVMKASMSVWPSILDAAEQHDAAAVVTGSRGLSGVSRALGSVSSEVVHHCRRPVLVVPSAQGGVETEPGA